MRYKPFVLFLIVLLTASCFSFGSADALKPNLKDFDVSSFGSAPILHGGRIKPVETYASHVLKQFSGKSSVEDLSALEFFSLLIFDPRQTSELKIFLANHPDVATALNIEPEKRRRYSFSQIEPSLGKLEELARKASEVEDDQKDLVQKEILRLYSNISLYFDLSQAVSFALPGPAFSIQNNKVKQILGLEEKRNLFSFWEMMQTVRPMTTILQNASTKQNDIRSEEENIIVNISKNMYMMGSRPRGGEFKIIPIRADQIDSTWVTPWDVISVPALQKKYHSELAHLANITEAFREGKQSKFDAEARAYSSSIRQIANDEISIARVQAELIYQKIDPFFWSLVLYWLTMILFLLYLLFQNKWIYRSGMFFLILAFIPHITGIIARIYIMQRAPVATLYETFIFVSVIITITVLFMEKYLRNGISPLAGSISGVVLLHIAARYGSDGDTMEMLVAVLNSNFWLSTHVTTITIGYSACLLAGVLGHIWLIRAILPGNEKKSVQLNEIYKMIYGTICFGLLFSFIGTVLGGIWADQSWGRFWGWDPKENGALLIVLWCAILLHGKYWGYFRQLGFALGAVFGTIIVVIAWFGVNLLSVGLHSYGFTEGAATRLITYIGGELVFMLVTGGLLKIKPRLTTGH